MGRSKVTLDADEIAYQRYLPRRRMVQLAEDLQSMESVVTVATPSWTPTMEFAVSDNRTAFGGGVTLLAETGTPYRLSIEPYKDRTIVRARSQDGDSLGIVTALEVVDTIYADREKWEAVWNTQ